MLKIGYGKKPFKPTLLVGRGFLSSGEDKPKMPLKWALI